MNRRARLLIADDQRVRRVVRAALGHEHEICAEAGNCTEAINEAARTQPEICVIGREIPGDGVKAVRGILAVAPETEVIVIDAQATADRLLATVRAGAVGYLPGDATPEHVRRVVGAVAAHEAAVPRSMVRDLLTELRSATVRRAARVTDREADVLDAIRRGHSTAEIARQLEISPVTVRRHLSELMHKFGAANRAALLSASEQLLASGR